ncbi:MAG TPA: hypothetical protein VEB66_06815 [Opitutaceae bacterium]|nr:hypothetical protein [Opitutaceae bacterium]
MIRPVGATDGAASGPESEGRPHEAGGERFDEGAVALVETETNGAPPAAEEGAPVGPSEGEEAAFLAEQRTVKGTGPVAATRAGAASEEEPATSLPPLEDLVNRIPAPTRALLDELFRAKFVTVKRVPKSALK